ncbi:hypothetical protein HZ326_30738 [Fusarium oxysporum f. sp. albedinis]|nr:hypothetical protein HZ326_30738 [Fusarium oxysporum f. sp. albedinis]
MADSLLRDNPRHRLISFSTGSPANPSIYKRSPNDTPIRKYLYTQLIEVMAQLQKLEFTTSGSLVPDHDVVPVVDEVLSIPPN